MKKRLFSLLLIVLSLFALASCQFFAEDGSSLEIISYPELTYAKGSEFNWEGLQIKITTSSGTQILTYEEAIANNEVVLPEIVIGDQEGTYTATIRFQGVKASFQYVVLDNIYAGGNGTKEFPYQVSTLAQFQSLRLRAVDAPVEYFVIINDIDCSKDFEYEPWEGNLCTRNAIIDGQNHSLMNVQNGYIFGNINHVGNGGGAEKNNVVEIKNLKVFETGKGAKLCYACSGTVLFENVDFYGSRTTISSNESLFIEAGRWLNATFKDCQNYCDILGTGRETALFVGQYARWSNLYFVNCQNYATISGGGAGFIEANAQAHYDEATTERFCNFYIDEQTKNYGKIISFFGQPGYFNSQNSKSINQSVAFDKQCTLDITVANVGIKVYDYANQTQLLTGAEVKSRVSGGSYVLAEQKLTLQEDNSGNLVVNDSIGSTHHYSLEINFGVANANGGEQAVTLLENVTPTGSSTNLGVAALSILNGSASGNSAYDVPSGYQLADVNAKFSTSFKDLFKVASNGTVSVYALVNPETSLQGTNYICSAVKYKLVAYDSNNTPLGMVVIVK